jgi:hypothetical protein
MTVAEIRKDGPVLAEMEAKGGVKMIGAMYNLETGCCGDLQLRLPEGISRRRPNSLAS